MGWRESKGAKSGSEFRYMFAHGKRMQTRYSDRPGKSTAIFELQTSRSKAKSLPILAGFFAKAFRQELVELAGLFQ
jgi:hypothetical protein